MVQSVTRVVKSGLVASNGQISTHLLQWIQLDSTFRSVARNRLPIEKTAPLGQTYLHQNRGFKKPNNKINRNSAMETMCPQLKAGTKCHPRIVPLCIGSPINNRARVITGIAATKPESSTPSTAATRTPASK